jgi:hypothetical protein
MRRKRLAVVKPPSRSQRLKARLVGLGHQIPATSLAEIGLGVGATAAGAVLPPARMVLLPMGAYATVTGARALGSELGYKGVHLPSFHLAALEEEYAKEKPTRKKAKAR